MPADQFIRHNGHKFRASTVRRYHHELWTCAEHGQSCARDYSDALVAKIREAANLPGAKYTPNAPTPTHAEVADMVNHPPHYTSSPSGVECITVTRHMNFCVGNAVKYLWRAGQKGDPIEDFRKAAWYVQQEIDRLQQQAADVCRECGGTVAQCHSSNVKCCPDCTHGKAPR